MSYEMQMQNKPRVMFLSVNSNPCPLDSHGELDIEKRKTFSTLPILFESICKPSPLIPPL